jgi:hypothetical protein
MVSKKLQRRNAKNWEHSIRVYESKQHKRKVKKLAEIERKLDGVNFDDSWRQQQLRRPALINQMAARTTAKMIKLLKQDEWKLKRQLKRGY